MLTRPRVWRTSSSPPLHHDDDRLPSGDNSTIAAPKPRSPPSHVGKVLPAAAAGPLGGYLCTGRRLSRQCGHDDLASRTGIPGDTACAVVAGTGPLRRLAFCESGLLPPRKPVGLDACRARDPGRDAAISARPGGLSARFSHGDNDSQVRTVHAPAVARSTLCAAGFGRRVAGNDDIGNAPHGDRDRHVGYGSAGLSGLPRGGRGGIGGGRIRGRRGDPARRRVRWSAQRRRGTPPTPLGYPRAIERFCFRLCCAAVSAIP